MQTDGYAERKRVALLGIPDDALDILNHYTQSSDWEAVVVVNDTPGAYATRMAAVLGIPVRDTAERDDLASCDLVIVGTDAGTDVDAIRSMLLDTRVEVADLDSASRVMEFHPFAEGGGREGMLELGDEIDSVLEEFGAPADSSELEFSYPADAVEADLDAEPDDEEPESPAPLAGTGYDEVPVDPRDEAFPLDEEFDDALPETQFEEIPVQAGYGIDAGPTPTPTLTPAPTPTLTPTPVREPAVREQIMIPRPRSGAQIPRFDLSAAFGRQGSDTFNALRVDGQSSDLKALFQRVLAATGAKTASIMLPEPGGEHLAIAASVGLPKEIVSATRPRRDGGLVGRAYAGGTPVALGAEVPQFAEAGELTYRLAASVPLRRHGDTAGVLSVNLESTEPISEAALLSTLEGLEAEALDAVIRSVDLTDLSPEARRDYLFRELDTIMSADASFPERLLGTAEALQRGIGADFSHVYLVDPLSQRLELISPPRGGVSAEGRYAPLDRGFYSWVVDRGRLQLVTAADPQDGTEHGVAYLPVRNSRPYALLILEHFILTPGDRRTLEDLLTCVIEQLEELFEVEQGVSSQDVLAGIRMRIADKKLELDVLPPALRAQPAIEYGLSILGAEAAIWVEHPQARPVIAQPQTRQAARIVADAWDTLDTLCTWIRDQGSTAWGGDGQGWDPGAPGGPVPYVGVRDERGGGVLLAFFSPQESGTTSQMPARILIETLEGISGLIPYSQGQPDSGDDAVENLERAA